MASRLTNDERFLVGEVLGIFVKNPYVFNLTRLVRETLIAESRGMANTEAGSNPRNLAAAVPRSSPARNHPSRAHRLTLDPSRQLLRPAPASAPGWIASC